MRTPPHPGAPGREGSIERRDFLRGAALAGTGLALGCRTDAGRAERGAVDRLPPTGSDAASAPPLLIHGASVFDTRTGSMRPDTSVLVRDGRIEAVAAAAELGPGSDAAEGATRVDGAGLFLLPGLIDAHVHVSHILYQSHMTGDEVLPFYLGHGVTSIRSTGDNVPAQRLVELFADEHPEISPNVFRCSFLIDGDPPWHPDVGWALRTPEEVEPFVADMAAWGVKTLKVYVGTGREIGRRVIEVGHEHGLVVTGHLLDYHTADAVRDGLDCIEHIYTVSNFLLDDPEDRHSINLDSDECRRLVDLIAEHEVRVDPTLMVFWGTLLFMDLPEVYGHPDHDPMPARLKAFWDRDREARILDWGAAPLSVREGTWEKYLRLTGMLRDAGVRLLVGTDAPEPQVAPGASLHHEMEFLVDAGLSPGEALTAATLENARILREEENRGSIEPELVADLVLLEADPLDEIRNTRRIRSVVRDGRLLDPARILAAAPTQ
ncbi:amidohydrolase family protein [Candidatus Palauibacter sp.]|uniref:amidohydrolase family protein n=1 Tax=Candidatus Palauibacter sp. TaxID=3101350 RepID=UPI003B020810